jgi:AP-3 complex subunit sigma
VCELDLVFQFDEVSASAEQFRGKNSMRIPKVHHILAEIIQGGLVLETNVEEIDNSGMV